MLQIQENISLKPFNSFGIAVNARYFVKVQDKNELFDLFESPIVKENELLIIGGGSNILFTKDFEGLVIKLDIQGIETKNNNNQVLVTAGAGVVWSKFVEFCVRNNWAGVENLSLIPGTVGASPIQNIGAYGVELKDVFESCEAFEIQTKTFKKFTFKDCHFGYRESVFKGVLKGQYILTAVTFKLNLIAQINTGYGAIETELSNRNILNPNIADVSKVVSEIRVSKLPDPSTIGNAGSFFKNPILEKEDFLVVQTLHPTVVHYPTIDGKIKLAAGWLIEQAGWKGKTIGHTGTWKNQALVLVNHGGATGQEVYDFSEEIIRSVQAYFGVKLEREVNVF